MKFKVVFVLVIAVLVSCKNQNKETKPKEVTTEIKDNNPIIRHIRTADPSAHIWEDGKVWIYTSHDMEDATFYDSINGYHAFSSTDMVNWTDHGEVLHSRNIPWGVSGWMWAPTAIYKNDKYYLLYQIQF